MGKSSGSDGKRDFPKGGGVEKLDIKNPRDLATIKDNAVYREMKRGISRYHAVLGVRERSVKIADLPMGVNGALANVGGANQSIYLNSSVYDKLSRSAIEKRVRLSYYTGWSARTNKPIQHTITHELAHATWNSEMKSANAKAAGKEISKLGRQWLNDSSKKGYGRYGESSVDEFWAEVVAKAVHGTPDKYTRKAKAIAKKYKL
jgi:hypothetical protein